ncbi:alpha/beta fold hydrolase [Kineosporia succinea]|uniref:Pimeloyl-ACP methyl ester carboxylesterase n=1 Tax=Kineosporia succinea TaxID=84632 RepID=A0ABT9P6S7_9ACTN|nr:alpha/beta hydrolase [Kineosporia succinea]MDP9828409.1 pimeloyl-ACP methyl ester carboxylesterase [Kineosporia succinea]
MTVHDPARVALARRVLGALARRVAGRDALVVTRPVHPDPANPAAGTPAPADGGPASRRPADPGRESRLTFSLTAVRTGPRGRTPVLFIPGGPGLASVIPYRGLRRAATRLGLDVIMVEHRGIGLSRRDANGHDLPLSAVTVTAAADDLAAVLDAAGVPDAVVYGSSYGSYLAQVFAARHPGRVAALVLDSPLLSVEDDLADVRAHRRRRLWDEDPTGLTDDRLHRESPGRDEVERDEVGRDEVPSPAPVVRRAAQRLAMAELSRVAEVVYEFAGPDTLRRLLAGDSGRARLLRHLIARTGRLDGPGTPHVMEPDLVAGIAFGTLGFGIPPDGGPLDPQLHQAGTADNRPRFAGEPVDLRRHLEQFAKPLVVISGERDLRTPRPIADRIVALAPHTVLVPIAGLGHSALDGHQLAAVHVARAVADGRPDDREALAARLGALSLGPGTRLEALPRRGPAAHLGPLLRIATYGLRSHPQ